MDTGKVYHDSEGNECSIWQAVRREPDWAATRIQEGEKAIERVIKLETVMNPRMWTKEMNDAWHKNLPDTRAAFAALLAIA